MVGDVAAGLGGGHAGHGVAQRGPLLERGQDGEFHGAPQGRLADEQAGQRGVLVHGLVGQHPDGFELLVGRAGALRRSSGPGCVRVLRVRRRAVCRPGRSAGSRGGPWKSG